MNKIRISTKRNEKKGNKQNFGAKNIIIELKFYLEFKRRFAQSEERISQLEERLLNIKSEARKQKTE